jgi:hypothetical protein
LPATTPERAVSYGRLNRCTKFLKTDGGENVIGHVAILIAALVAAAAAAL